LIKDLAGAPLLFMKEIKFPSDIKDWKEDVNGQWGFGANFLYHSGNNPDLMIFLGRLPMIGILILLGFFVFKWTKELFGNEAGLLALFLYSFSPTLLAHGRLVTTDVGAAFGVFFSTYYFLKFLKDSSWKNLFIAGLTFGIAELLKFSLILLIPFFGILVLLWSIVKSSAFNFKDFLRNFWFYFSRCLLVGLVAFLLMYTIYLYHVWNYPPANQKRDIEFILASFKIRPLANLTAWMATQPILRPIAQYMLGLFMALQRASGGNTGYFFGEISAAGWKGYFPFVYLVKETLTFHILTLIALAYALSLIFKKNSFSSIFRRFYNWLKNHFAEFSMLLFILIYWTSSLKSNLNIGVRHLLPVFPFTIALVSFAIIKWVKQPPKNFYTSKYRSFLEGSSKIKITFLTMLLLWQVISVLNVYPHFLSYFNELIGTENGYQYVVDSNYDWGQDLRRLKIWIDKNLPAGREVYVDYFGGGNPEYYLGEKFLPWWGARNPAELPKGSYLAVSATFLQGGRGKPAPGFDQPTGYYNWLNDYLPIARIGYSIFVYRIN
jgi:4-amino-4-deoxy-L-arabinose transferase-like glycosyltransferase